MTRSRVWIGSYCVFGGRGLVWIKFFMNWVVISAGGLAIIQRSRCSWSLFSKTSLAPERFWPCSVLILVGNVPFVCV